MQMVNLSESISQLGLSDRVEAILIEAFGKAFHGMPNVSVLNIKDFLKKKRSEVVALVDLGADDMTKIDEALTNIGQSLQF